MSARAWTDSKGTRELLTGVKRRSDVVRFEFVKDPSGCHGRMYYRVQGAEGGTQDRGFCNSLDKQ